MKEKILKSPEFRAIVRSKNAISIFLTVVELFIYFGFILLLAYGKELLNQKIYGPITAGIPIGIGVIVLSWILTGIYVTWANKSYDDNVAKVREKLGGE
ncbi:MAG: DUF485 domain-containing protein [Thermodesulfovibrio sp.]|nr:DUF485 domain-containing protein [Thermodesulfovibrio sp.]